MSFTTLTISSDYGYVVLAAASTFILNFVHAANTGMKRKVAKVPYPNAYATPEQHETSPAHLAFSSAQRAHAHYIEHQPSALAAMLISGLYFPRTAAALGFLWSVNRFIYMRGYSDPTKGKKGEGRMKGLGFALAQFGLVGLSITTGLKIAGLV